MTQGRIVVFAVLAVAAAVAPLDMSTAERLRALATCAGAIALHALLGWLPTSRPKRLLAAVDVGLVVDAVAVGLLALQAGGADSLAVWLLPLFCLAAALGLDLWQGLKALILSGLVVGWLSLQENDPQESLSDSIGPVVLAAAIVVVAVWLTRVNEGLLRSQRERMRELHTASLAFAAADPSTSLTAIAEGAALELLQDDTGGRPLAWAGGSRTSWDVTVTAGAGGTEERNWRADGRAFVEIPVVGRVGDDEHERRLAAITASHEVPGERRFWIRRESLQGLRMLATALSAALVQRELLERLQHLSMSDALTGLGNRRAFDEALEAEMARARRAKGSMGLVILDVDHFKQFNDRHGHQAGDDALVTVARVLAGEARAEDRACRIGGEEFALLLPGADDATAAAVAERVRRAVEVNTAPAAGVTVSLGVAASHGDDPRGLLETADSRLYVAKAAGRNRVIAA